ncbi:MAG: TIGR03084 family metal-binding protein [Paracoccaceae bacterium]
MRQAQDFLDESRVLAALIAPLSDEAMRRRTAFKGWSIDEILRHLHVWNEAALWSLQDPPRFQAYFEMAKPHVAAGGMPGFEASFLNDLSGASLKASWTEAAEQLAAAFAGQDPKLRVAWAGPSMSARSSITARQMETWAHGQAIFDLVGVVRQNGDRIQNIVVLGVNTYAWTFACRKQEPPGLMPHLRLVAPSGALWTFGAESEAERIEGPAEGFAQVVTQTRNIADVGLTVTGRAATAWMAQAQCFAGRPETPPAKGARRIGAAWPEG